MKHKTLSIMLAVLMSIVTNTVLAYTCKIDGIYYDIDGNNAIVTHETINYPKNIESNYFYYGDVIIPESIIYNGNTYTVTEIGQSAFYACTSLTSVTIPNSVTLINTNAFERCTALTSITIPNNVARIYSNTFYGCKGLTSVTIPNNVTIIDDHAFHNCWGLKSVIIGNSVNIIKNGAFEGCTALTDVYCNAINVPSYAKGTSNTIFPSSILESAILHVPFVALSSYKEDSEWGQFNNIESIEPVFKLTYMFGDEEYKSYDLIEGMDIPVPEKNPFNIEGYTFYWIDVPETMPANDLVINGMFTANSHTLTYLVDGEEYKVSNVTYGTALTPETPPTKEGHTFSGWSEIPSTMPDNDVVVTGNFTVNTHTLTYKVDGLEYKTSNVAYGTAIIPESVPTKEGYTFSGWSEIPTTMPDYDVIITGQFTVNSYTLMYILDGVVYKNLNVAYGTTITAEVEPTKEGYTFAGWSEIPSTMPAHDVIIMGAFTVNEYTLIYKVDGQEYKTSTIAYGTAITPEAEPTKEGYTFSGWSEIPATMPAKDIEVIGTFNINSYTLTYKVDGEEYKTSTVEYGSTITPETEPTKEGYTFAGWSDIPSTMPAHDVEITGSFNVNSYSLIYKVDGEVYKTLSVAYGTTITPGVAPTKEGYTFSGWSEIPATMPAKDVTITGTFSKGAYKLTYMVDGVLFKIVAYDYGTTIIPEATPTKEGYTFSGWSEIPETMPAEDVTINGSFTVNKYKVVFIYGNNLLTTIEVEYGATIPLPESLDKEGYTLIEWLDVPETMPARDIVIYASYTDGIKMVRNSENEKMRIFDLQGRRHAMLQRGVNIVRYSDGTTKRVMVK